MHSLMEADEVKRMKDEVMLSRLCCAKCNVLFYITIDHDNRLKNSYETFYCPSGHTQSYKKPKGE